MIGEPTPDMWLLRRFKQLGEIWEPLTALLTEAAPSSIELDDDSIGDFLLGGMDRLAATGLEVLLPRDLVKELSVKATVSASSDSESSGVFALEALCEVKVTASLDGTALSAAELKLLIDSQADVVRIRNTFVRVDARLARQLQRRLSGAEALGAALGGQIVLDGEAVELETTGALADLVARVRALDSQRSHRDGGGPPCRASALSTTRGRLAAPDQRVDRRWHPRRRYGSRQDHAGHRASPLS